ncbi:MAG: twin-arginine translocation signal domain-containing protein, partial [Candidatus Methylomirabilis sp.]
MTEQVGRREFLGRLGVTAGAAVLAPAIVDVAAPREAGAAEPPKGRIPDTPLKFGHMTFMSGPGAMLGEPSYKGHVLAVE